MPHDELAGFDPADQATAQRLMAERPVPAPAFRGDLRRRLAGRGHGRPSHLWRRVGLAAATGSLAFAVSALGLAGIGPLG